MAGTLNMGPEDLRSRLEEFDRAVCLLHPGRAFRLVIVGGGALVLVGCLARSTSDLDALVFPPDMLTLMEEYDISGRVKTYEDEFAHSLEYRLAPIDVETSAVECFTASIEDVVIAKLHSHREKDAIDIREPSLLERIDRQRLDDIAAEMERQRFFERRYKEFRISYEQYREECGPCEC